MLDLNKSHGIWHLLQFTSSLKSRRRHTNNEKWVLSFRLLLLWIWNHSSSLFRLKNSIEKSKNVTITKNNVDVSNLGFFTITIIQAYSYLMHVSVLTGRGGDAKHTPGIWWNDAMVVHFGQLRVTDAVTFDNTRTPKSFISHGRWQGSKLLEDNMANIEKREQEQDKVTIEVTQVTQVSEFCEIFCSANIHLWNEVEINILLNCVVIIWSPPFLQ